MGKSLRDQMRQAGLATKKQVKAVEKDLREQARADRKREQAGEAVGPDPVAEAAQRALEEEAARIKALAREEEAARRAKERRAQVKDLVDQHGFDPGGPLDYHFADGARIRCLPVTEDDQIDLAQGDLAIVVWDGAYRLVPASAAAKIRDRMPEAVVCWHEDGPPPEDDWT